MLDPQKITMGRVRQAYDLSRNEVEKTIQVLWPNAVFPVELWNKVHETYWRAFADSNQTVYKIESPTLPPVDTSAKLFLTHLYSMDVVTFFRKLSLNIQAKILQKGLKNILEETYGNIDDVYPEEREYLFSTLSRLETVDIYDQYSPDSELFEERILSLPISSYHFISHIFPETVVVNKIAAIEYWSVIRGYPLGKEVKGITHALVKDVIKKASQGAPPVPETAPALDEPAAIIPPQEQGNVIRVPAALWEGKPPAAVREAMKEEYGVAVIAYVLRNWCKVNKTETGRLISEKRYEDEKSYRNLVDDLMEEASHLTIVKA